MENISIAEIITLEKHYKIQSPNGLSIMILITSQNQLNTLKEILIMYLIGRFYAQLLHRNISGRT